VECEEPMVSVRDLDWKRDGSLGYFIVFGRGLIEENESIEEFFAVLVRGGGKG